PVAAWPRARSARAITRDDGSGGERRSLRDRGGGGTLLPDAASWRALQRYGRAARPPARDGASHDHEPMPAGARSAARVRIRHREPLRLAARSALLRRILRALGLHRRRDVDRSREQIGRASWRERV